MGLLKTSLAVAIMVIVASYLMKNFESRGSTDIFGTYHPAFRKVAEKFRENVRTGKERGAAFALYVRGNLVVDLWGGYADEESLRMWAKDTMTVANSASKGVGGIVVATMVEKGHLSYDRPVMDYWPEFKQHGKGNITVEMLLSHQAGLPVIEPRVTLFDVRDNPQKVESTLAEQKPLWSPGTVQSYHTISYGLFVDTLIYKADPGHRDVAQVFYEDIAKPFGKYHLDMYMNTPKSQYYRTARIHEDSPNKMLYDALFLDDYRDLFLDLKFRPDSVVVRSLTSVLEYTKGPSVHNNPDLRNIPNSCCYGTGTARGFAKLYSILSNGGVYKEKELLPQKLIDRLSTPLISGYDVTLSVNTTYGPGTRFKKSRKDGHVMFGYSGHGGQAAYADKENHIGIAYLTNYFSLHGNGDDPRYLDLEDAVYDCLEDYHIIE